MQDYPQLASCHDVSKNKIGFWFEEKNQIELIEGSTRG
jgi:hypothetical protein